MSLLEASGYLGGWRNAPDVSNQCLQVLVWGQAKQTKPAPGLQWCGCPSLESICLSRSEYTSRTLLLTGPHSHL